MALEEDAHLWDGGQARRGNLEGADDILATVGAEHAQGQLTAGEDDRLAQVLEHKAQRRSRIGHGVGAVEHNETIIIVVLALDNIGNIDPQGGGHIRRIDDIVEGHRIDAITAMLEMWDGVVDTVERKGVERAVLVLHHADGAARVDYENLVVFHAPITQCDVEYCCRGIKMLSKSHNN